MTMNMKGGRMKISTRTIAFQNHVEDVLEELALLIDITENEDEKKGLIEARGVVEYQYEFFKDTLLKEANKEFGEQR